MLVTNFMELNPSWEAANCEATQELPIILWNLKVYFHVHKSPKLAPILSQISPVHTTPSYVRSISILTTHLHLGRPGGPFLLAFQPIPFMHSSSPPSCYMPSPSHPPWLDHSNYTWRRVQVMKLLIMQFSPTSCHFISLRSKYSPQHPVLKRPQSVCLLWCLTKQYNYCWLVLLASTVLDNVHCSTVIFTLPASCLWVRSGVGFGLVVLWPWTSETV
jgi:hypothetical protein